MSKIFIIYIIFISFINFILNDNNNNTTKQDNIITEPDLIDQDIKSDNNINKNNNSQNPEINTNVLEINNTNITTSDTKTNLNFTIYDNSKILEIITNSSFSKSENSTVNGQFIEDDNLTKLEEVENIVIQNTHEDQLAESIFYLLSFVLVIFIILFLYKFYKCYCENTIKEFGEEGTTIKNISNDPELQRISTSDEDNIIEVTQN